MYKKQGTFSTFKCNNGFFFEEETHYFFLSLFMSLWKLREIAALSMIYHVWADTEYVFLDESSKKLLGQRLSG